MAESGAGSVCWVPLRMWRAGVNPVNRAMRWMGTGLLCMATLSLAQQPAEVWRFDRLDRIGGHATTIAGHPQIIHTPYGPATQFDGLADGLFVDVHPLAGDATWTWEVIFRPDADGAAAQRFFHLQEVDPATGEFTRDHMTLEIRIVDNQWCLDSYATKNGIRMPLLNCKLLHPLGQWYRVSFVYDGKQLRNYVGDALQGAADVQLAPAGPGQTSVGTRINKAYFFKGAILSARFTPRALPPGEFLPLPKTESSAPKHR